MLKILPDPPSSQDHAHFLEDTLVRAIEYAFCALTVANQAVQLKPWSPGAILMLAAAREMEAVRTLLESALTQVQHSVQVPGEPRTLH
ncbi:hypothetical protein HU735_25750 [Pseudomonas sp. BW16M2]|uniref:hypothetical protein n=1 Tax=Pseudomonas sp. BW16M2 TaxID=2745489 RepID=UPI0016442D48|nr:hypothetical protein [Pseudomonas sp. BW16M2]MBC3438831.1 hypothetical protein [Pseudomonas sp. BW16M2]